MIGLRTDRSPESAGLRREAIDMVPVAIVGTGWRLPSKVGALYDPGRDVPGRKARRQRANPRQRDR
jgi:hypothetical protein